jgi:Skp family chaperone for outer membrane proteins
MRGLLAGALLSLAPVWAGGLAVAQEASVAGVQSPILTLDQEELFAKSLWGKRVAAEFDSRSQELAAENRLIESRLVTEERALTDLRATLSPEAFRVEAEAFDARVVAIRREQDGKARAIGTLLETERKAFFSATYPVLGEVMKARNAIVILDARTVFLAADIIDVTDELVARIDGVIGAGPAPTASEAPAPEPETGSD